VGALVDLISQRRAQIDRLESESPLPAKVTAIEKLSDQYHVIVQIGTRYRGSFNTLAFGEVKPYSGSLKDGRLDLVYYRHPWSGMSC
jgi:hypothetical protein